jgi:tetratricopeptide (TPR) repeat protein
MTPRPATASRALATGALLLLAACAAPPPASPQPAALTSASPEAMVAAIRAAAGHDDSELAVQPLRDPMVEDLREEALHLESRQQYAAAAAALDKALAIVPEDPALLQERAEAALLLRQFDAAERLARQAYDLGARVGPLCRRHWATVRQARLAAGDAAGAQAAQSQVDGCKVAGPNRF